MCYDDCEKHFPGRRRYNGILFFANSRQNRGQNPETIIFKLTFDLKVGFTELRSLFFDLAFQNETIYKVPSSRKSETKKRKMQRQKETLTSSTTTVFLEATR